MTPAANRLPINGGVQKRSRRIPAEKARANDTSGARQTLSGRGDRRGGTARVDTNGAVVAVDTADPPDIRRVVGQAASLPHDRHTRSAQQPLDDLLPAQLLALRLQPVFGLRGPVD